MPTVIITLDDKNGRSLFGKRLSKDRLLIQDIITSYGTLISAREIDYRKNVMAGFTWTNEWLNDDSSHKEYLFLMRK